MTILEFVGIRFEKIRFSILLYSSEKKGIDVKMAIKIARRGISAKSVLQLRDEA